MHTITRSRHKAICANYLQHTTKPVTLSSALQSVHQFVCVFGNRITQQEAQLMLTNPRDAFRGKSRSTNMVPFWVHCDRNLKRHHTWQY